MVKKLISWVCIHFRKSYISKNLSEAHIKNTAKTAPFKIINLHKLTIMNTNSDIFTIVSFCDYEKPCRYDDMRGVRHTICVLCLAVETNYKLHLFDQSAAP